MTRVCLVVDGTVDAAVERVARHLGAEPDGTFVVRADASGSEGAGSPGDMAAAALTDHIASAPDPDIVVFIGSPDLAFSSLTRRRSVGVEDVLTMVWLTSRETRFSDAADHSLRMADAVVVPAADVLTEMLERHGLEADRVFVAGEITDLPSPRHPNAQAGLATAAVHATEDRSERRGLGTRAARWALRLLPAGLARVAVRVLPQRLKDRFRSVASWREEQAVRDRRDRFADLVTRIEAGDFPELDAPDVTVVIPVFDQGEWLQDAVASVFAQSHPSWEVVVVDDGSTDPGALAAVEVVGAWPRVRCLRQENRGLSAARNSGMSVARGSHLVPLDADDELDPRFLEVMLGSLAGEPGAAFAHCWAELFGDVEAIWVTRPFNPYWELLQNSVVGCVMLRTAAWEAVGGYDETMRHGNEDWELWIRLMEAGWGRVRVPEVLFRYRKHGVSMSVRTEGAFEVGLREIADRHPSAYARQALAARKRSWYPFVSLFGRELASAVDVLDGDSELFAAGVSAETVSAARGKYLVEARTEVAPEVVERMAIAIERDRARGWVSEHDVVIIRRWVVLDPFAGFEAADDPLPDWVTLRPGSFSDPEWCLDPGTLPPGVRIDRQRPEEAAVIPTWVPR